MIGVLSILAGVLGIALGIRIQVRIVVVLGFSSLILGIASVLVGEGVA